MKKTRLFPPKHPDMNFENLLNFELFALKYNRYVIAMIIKLYISNINRYKKTAYEYIRVIKLLKLYTIIYIR